MAAIAPSTARVAGGIYNFGGFDFDAITEIFKN